MGEPQVLSSRPEWGTVRALQLGGRALRTWDPLLTLIRATSTVSGVAVKAVFQPGDYATAEMDALRVEHDAVCPTWNYAIRLRTPA